MQTINSAVAELLKQKTELLHFNTFELFPWNDSVVLKEQRKNKSFLPWDHLKNYFTLDKKREDSRFQHEWN